MTMPPEQPAAQRSQNVDKYTPTPAEHRSLDRTIKRTREQPPAPKFKLKPAEGKLSLLPDHPDSFVGAALLLDTMGTADAHLAEGLLLQLADAGRHGAQVTQRELNMMVAITHALGPRDATEALLATQMAAVHEATMVAARRLTQVETIDQQNSANNLFNKLARTFTMQLDALKRYRSTGEQRVTVNHQHVNVNAQQAVVGVQQGVGGSDETNNQSHALGEMAGSSSADACSAPLLSHQQAVGLPLPGAGSQRQERVPHARR